MSDHEPHDQHEEQQPQQQNSPENSPENKQKRKEIKTFHCRYCSHLLLASTRSILSANTPLARRGGGAARDRALILDVPARTSTSTSTSTTSATTSAQAGSRGQGGGGGVAGPELGLSEDTRMAEAAGNTGPTEREKEKQKQKQEAHYTIPLATLLPDAKPVIIRRDDGFEKRILFKCGRCRVVVGYEIVPKTPPTVDTEEEDEEKDRVMYLLPGSLVGTEDLQGEGSAVERNNVLKQMEAEWAQWVTV